MSIIVLGVSGSIAAYRAADLARELMRAGHTVRVCLTDSAQKFVTRTLFETLTGQPCLVDTFEEPEIGRMAHIDWARDADLVLIAPATANTINALGMGLGTDMLTTLALAFTGTLVIAPAMNPTMFASDTVAKSVEILRDRGVIFIQPEEGDVASGESGLGKLASNTDIVAECQALLVRSRLLAGKRILITSGPTQEAIDDVRFLTNRSSGKMGLALVRAALLLGGDVTVVSGPVGVTYPRDAKVQFVKSAQQMLDACLPLAPDADWIVGCAAVADYRPKSPISGKIRRSEANLQVELVPNPDIIASLAKVTNGQVVGFAAEPSSELDFARKKVSEKGLKAIVANDVSRGDIGFGADSNELTLLFADGKRMECGVRSKLLCALWLWESLVAAN